MQISATSADWPLTLRGASTAAVSRIDARSKRCTRATLLKKSRPRAKEVLASLEIAFIYRPRDAIRTCLWPIVVMQRRNASFLAVPVVVDRVPRGRSIWLLSDAGPQRPGPKPRTG